jgi:type I restriction enzyme, S subunit
MPLEAATYINTQILRGVVVPLPPIGEQAEIIRMVQCVQRATLAAKHRYQSLATLFNTLLHHLMTGKVRVV